MKKKSVEILFLSILTLFAFVGILEGQILHSNPPEFLESSFGAREYQNSIKLSQPLDADPNDFISVWDTSKTSDGSSIETQIKLPLESTGTYDFTVDWGDGTSDTITTYNQPEVTHTYRRTHSHNCFSKSAFLFNNSKCLDSTVSASSEPSPLKALGILIY